MACVEIRIALDCTDPPAGRLWSDAPGPGTPGRTGGAPVSFTGWLGLLRALDELLENAGDGASSER